MKKDINPRKMVLGEMSHTKTLYKLFQKVLLQSIFIPRRCKKILNVAKWGYFAVYAKYMSIHM